MTRWTGWRSKRVVAMEEGVTARTAWWCVVVCEEEKDDVHEMENGHNAGSQASRAQSLAPSSSRVPTTRSQQGRHQLPGGRPSSLMKPGSLCQFSLARLLLAAAAAA